MSKRKITKTSRSMTVPGGGTTHLAAEWTELDTTEYVYALRLMTTKGGKERKIRRYARWMGRSGQGKGCYWKMVSLAAMMCRDTRPAHVRPTKENHSYQAIYENARLAEKSLGCKCKVVKIALREVEDAETR